MVTPAANVVTVALTASRVEVGDNVMRVKSSEIDVLKAVQAELEPWGERPIHAGKMHAKKHDGTACRPSKRRSSTLLVI
jgi:hypothetical protein